MPGGLLRGQLGRGALKAPCQGSSAERQSLCHLIAMQDDKAFLQKKKDVRQRTGGGGHWLGRHHMNAHSLTACCPQIVLGFVLSIVRAQVLDLMLLFPICPPSPSPCPSLAGGEGAQGVGSQGSKGRRLWRCGPQKERQEVKQSGTAGSSAARGRLRH